MSYQSSDWKQAHTQAIKDARTFNRPMGIEKANEYGKIVYRVKMIPKDPAQRFGWECKCEVVEPTDPL